MWAKHVKVWSKGLGSKEVGNQKGKVGGNLDEIAPPPPTPPKRPKMKSTTDELYPQTPKVFVRDKNEALSPQLEEFCHEHPITLVSGIGAALELNLGLFSSKEVAAAHPDFPIEERIQDLQPSHENKDRWGEKTWTCDSRRSKTATTIAQYAEYQASTWQASVEGSQGISKEATDSCGNPKKKKIKFATNIDLSDTQMWKVQLDELQKLPEFVRVVSLEKNMLSHVGHPILGMNTVQLYMKVPGCRTPGHQENNNFCSVNINIGPGDCEWFGVPDDRWEGIRDLCQKNDREYLSSSWWPDLGDCAGDGIPVYRFIQRPGDLVWVNSGCVHWVQAIGFCNNIAWNVGPITLRQYQLGMERYEWNKGKKFQSLVPMVLLSWNLARKNIVTSAKLFESIKLTLLSSLAHCSKSLEFAKSNGVRVRFHGRRPNEATNYCDACEVEVFNVLFTIVKEDRNVVICLDCAKKIDPNLLRCLEEYKLKELQAVYDNFEVAPYIPPHPFSQAGRLPPSCNTQ